MAEIYFDHPLHGATVACDTNEARKLMGYGWVLRDPQPHGLKVPAELLPTAPIIEALIAETPPVEAPPIETLAEAPRRGRPPKAR